MCSIRVLSLLALLVGSAHCFAWDIVVATENRLVFYYHGLVTYTEDIPSHHFMNSVTYDPVHDRVLFSDYHDYHSVSISSFDLSTRKIQLLVTTTSNGYFGKAVYDPVTQLLFLWFSHIIYSYSLNPASSIKGVDENILVTLDHSCWSVAVDSCGGYIYWITEYEIERARFDGSERSVLIYDHVYERQSLAIDQQTQKIYWTETKRENGDYQLSIESADFNGKNRITLYITKRSYEIYGYSLAVSKDFIYWTTRNEREIWQLPKVSSQNVERKLFATSDSDFTDDVLIAAYYSIQEQSQGRKSCEALQRLKPNGTKPESSVSICLNYCFQGDCSVSAEGQPSCSCKAGYSGERCEVNACHKHCLNNGVCSLNEKNEAVCECTADYEGVRCDVANTFTGIHAENTTPQLLPDLRNEVRQAFKEDLKRMLQFFSDKIDDYPAKI